MEKQEVHKDGIKGKEIQKKELGEEEVQEKEIQEKEIQVGESQEYRVEENDNVKKENTEKEVCKEAIQIHEKQVNGKPLWTRNFKIITGGTVVSKLGSSIASFATGLLVLDYTGSVFLYALYMVMYTFPMVIMPLLAGPFIDKFSRRKTIYSLDFISAGIYCLFAIGIKLGYMSFVFLLIGCMLLGAIDSVYSVAYESFYPMLIQEGNYTKAYSISSTLESLTTVMIPVSALLYNLIGIVPLFIVDAVSFLIAAILETQIHTQESYVKKQGEEFHYKQNFLEGIDYLKENKGLLVITLYFMVTMFAQGALNVIGLPYFKKTYDQGEYVYIEVMAFMLIGRLVGGATHYKMKFPTQLKFNIALFVYFMICIIEGSYLYLPIPMMMLFCLVNGLLGVTSYNIRISATQSYVPDDKKGRFNGIFQMAVTTGMLLGELISGALAEIIPERLVISAFMGVNLIGVFVIMYRHAKEVKPIYNRQA